MCSNNYKADRNEKFKQHCVHHLVIKWQPRKKEELKKNTKRFHQKRTLRDKF